MLFMLDFKRVDKLLVYCVLFGCFLLLDYNTPTQNGESYNFVKSIILAPIIEEMLYRLIFIGIVFLGIEWVSNNPNSKFKVPIGIFSVFGLFYSIAFVFIPFYEEYL